MPYRRLDWPTPLRTTEHEVVFSLDHWGRLLDSMEVYDEVLNNRFQNLEEGIVDLWEEMWETRRDALPPLTFLENHRAYLRSMQGL
jgi:hypothetical protein